MSDLRFEPPALVDQTWFAQDGYIYQDALDGPTICEIEDATPEQVRAITAVPQLVAAGRGILRDPRVADFVETLTFQALSVALGKIEDGLSMVTPEDGQTYVTRDA